MESLIDKYQHIENLNHYLKKKKRIRHCVSVAEHMQACALYFGVNQAKAYLVGMYHDIAKELNSEQLIEYSQKYLERKIEPIQNFPFKKYNTNLLHGPAGAEIIAQDFKIVDPDILIAIAHHTTGGLRLSNLAKLAFIMDFCEPLRKHTTSEEIYHVLINNKNLPLAYYLTYYYTLLDVIKRKKLICPESILGYNEALDSIQ
ncbi:MAG: bis(5'-nucleosyl)-tetraphosphatase (symmetrical) YqeK [Spirochaetes bacterium]|nr:bis(5'-nucleosyl)-tetraphosphatase (symmetrical) YqeK [Spirochaetota bacterium]